MKKNNFLRMGMGIVLITLFVPLTMTGCGSSSKSGKAELANIIVTNDENFTVELGEPITAREWEDFKNGTSLGSEKTGTLSIGKNSPFEATLNLVFSSKAAVLMTDSIAGASRCPNGEDFKHTSGGTIQLNNNQFLYVRVTSESKKTVNYYKFLLRVTPLNTSVELSDITIGGISIPAEDRGTPGTTGWAAVTAGKAALGANNTNGAVVATPRQTTTTVRYGRSAGTANTPDGELSASLSGATTPFADGEKIYIEVTAQAGNKAYYILNVEVGRITTLSSVMLGGESVSMGTSYASVALARSNAGRYLFSDLQPEAGYTVAVTAADPNASASWAKATGSEAPGFGTNNVIKFADGDYFFIEVTPAVGETKGYYAVRINLRRVGVFTDSRTMVDELPPFIPSAAHGAWTGSIDNDDLITFTASCGAVRYPFALVPANTYGIDDIDDFVYMFVHFDDLVTGPGNQAAVGFRQYNSNSFYPNNTGSTTPFLSDGVYSIPKYIKFKVKDATGGGIAISAEDATSVEIRFTKVTFTNPERLTLSFDINDEDGTNPEPIEIYKGDYIQETEGANLARPKREGYIFAGWFDDDDNEIGVSTPITETMTVKAKWIDTVEPIFTNANTMIHYNPEFTVSTDHGNTTGISITEDEDGATIVTFESLRDGGVRYLFPEVPANEYGITDIEDFDYFIINLEILSGEGAETWVHFRQYSSSSDYSWVTAAGGSGNGNFLVDGDFFNGVRRWVPSSATQGGIAITPDGRFNDTNCSFKVISITFYKNP